MFESLASCFAFRCSASLNHDTPLMKVYYWGIDLVAPSTFTTAGGFHLPMSAFTGLFI
jgi:hypothetical protein